MIYSIPLFSSDSFEGKLVKALFLLTFYACLRAGEIVHADKTAHTLCMENLIWTHSTYTIKFASYKHSGRTGSVAEDERHDLPEITLPRIHSNNCPVLALREYIDTRGGQHGPIFINQGGQPVTRKQLSVWLKTAVELTGAPSGRYNTHSFRIGRTTQLAAEGHSDETIRRTGRWKSDAYKGYIQIQSFSLPR